MHVGRRAATALMSPNARSASAICSSPSSATSAPKLCSSANAAISTATCFRSGTDSGCFSEKVRAWSAFARRAGSPSRLAASTASRLTLSRRAPSAVCMSSVPSAPSVSTRSGRSSVGIASSAVSSSETSSTIDRGVGLVRPDARVVQRAGRRPDRLPVAEAESEVRGGHHRAPRFAHLVGALEGRRKRHQRVEAAAKVVGIAALDHLGGDRPMPSCL